MGFENLGMAIRERRKQLGITQLYLADLAEVNKNTIYKLERGQGNPSIRVLSKIAGTLGMELKLEVKKTLGTNEVDGNI